MLDQGWVASRNFSAQGVGYLRKSRPPVGLHADHVRHLEGPGAGTGSQR